MCCWPICNTLDIRLPCLRHLCNSNAYVRFLGLNLKAQELKSFLAALARGKQVEAVSPFVLILRGLVIGSVRKFPALCSGVLEMQKK